MGVYLLVSKTSTYEVDRDFKEFFFSLFYPIKKDETLVNIVKGKLFMKRNTVGNLFFGEKTLLQVHEINDKLNKTKNWMFYLREDFEGNVYVLSINAMTPTRLNHSSVSRLNFTG